MNWLVGENWSTGAVPEIQDQILLDDVFANTSMIKNVNGRAISHVNSDFLGTADGSLTIEQRSPYANILNVFQDTGAAKDLVFSVGQVSISEGATFSFSATPTNLAETPLWARSLALGNGTSRVKNAGDLLISFSGNVNNRACRGFLTIARGAEFVNTGSFSLRLNSANDAFQGATHVNALLGTTTNTGSITIHRSGSQVKAADEFGAARGGIEFASLRNAEPDAEVIFHANNATLTDTRQPGGASPKQIEDHGATLAVAGAFVNAGKFTINRIPLESKTEPNQAVDNDERDAESRTVLVQFGTFNNESSGAFVVNHENNFVPLTTTFSMVGISTLGAAANSGWISLKGTGAASIVEDGDILTLFSTRGGFTNNDGGVLTVDGDAVLANTGEFSNMNSQTSAISQNETHGWDTRGLRLESSTTSNATFTWATGVSIDPSQLSATDFSAENFTLGALALSTGSAAYLLAGGGDLLILGDFELSGKLLLGDWSAVTAEGGKGQTLIFAHADKAAVDGLIASGNIIAKTAPGYRLATFPSAGGDAFYIGATAVR